MKACSRCGGPRDRCGCGRAEVARRRRKAAANGLHSQYWRALRAHALVRDHGRCVLRVDEACTKVATSVHIRPELDGNHLAARLEDCQSACAHCHGVVDAPRARR